MSVPVKRSNIIVAEALTRTISLPKQTSIKKSKRNIYLLIEETGPLKELNGEKAFMQLNTDTWGKALLLLLLHVNSATAYF